MNKTKPLDRIDMTILKTLQTDGRITNVELAQKVNLSASPCLDASKLNCGMTAFIQVTLDRTTADVFKLFKAEVVKIKEIVECHLVAGGYDYLLKIRFINMDSYRLILEKVAGLPAISHTHTYIATEHIKEDAGVPFE